MQKIKLSIRNVSKSFPGVRALDGVNIDLREGTVHAIVGENGAGKSTLMKIISGMYKKDSGIIELDGKEINFNSINESIQAGIGMIYQELNYYPNLTVAENIFMNRYPNSSPFVNWEDINEKASVLLKEHNINTSADAKMKDLSIAMIQMIEIAKTVSFDAKVIIMDEPTSSISNKEVKSLFETIGRLKEKGISILYISHKMDEIFRIADDITVLRDGKSISSGKVSDYTEEKIISDMVGRTIDNIYPSRNSKIGSEVFKAINLTTRGKFNDVSFYINKGEVVGFSGLVGAGRSEVCRAIFGLDPLDSGEIFINGNSYKPKNVTHALNNKILMITEDRKKEGIISVRTCRENISISKIRMNKSQVINLGKEKEIAEFMVDELNIKTPNIEKRIDELSGGNQQKVLLARWLLLDCDLFILDEPTRGIDVGAKYEIYNIINNLASKGYAILVISSELQELIGICDRIYIMSSGKITGCLNKEEFSQESIMRYAVQNVRV